jgi:ubiquinone/menaquinone biosynthesis C-methylase UbiE
MDLNIACGFERREGCINLDIRRDAEADVISDAFKLPFKSNAFDRVYMHNFLEHVTDTVGIMEEVWRVCRNNAVVDIVVPHFSSRSAWATADHVKGFALNAFINFSPSSKYRLYKPVFTTKRRRLVYSNGGDIISRIGNYLASKIPDTFERRLLYYFGGCDAIELELMVLK